MPSVGMRRTTRVFGVVKGADGARVLRSGRKLWPDSGDSKLRKGNDKDDWLNSIVSADGYNGNNDGIGCDDKVSVNGSGDDDLKQNGDLQKMNSSREVILSDNVGEGIDESLTRRSGYDRVDGMNKMFAIVYSRKRKSDGVTLDAKRYGKNCYKRKRRQKKDIASGFMQRFGGITIVVDKGSSRESNVISSFLCSLLKYMKRVSVKLSALLKFVMSEPIYGVYFSQGVQFSRDSSSIHGAGSCKITGSQGHCPIFSVDYSSVPVCFMLMNCKMLLRYMFVPLAFVHNLAAGETVGDSADPMEAEDCEDEQSCLSWKSRTVPDADADAPVSRLVLHLPVRSSKVEIRSSQRRHGSSRGIRKRRSSLRARGGRNHSLSGIKKCNGTLASDLVSAKKNGFPFSSVVSGNKIRRSTRTKSAANNDETSSAVPSSQDSESVPCTANLLTIQSDLCFREGGVNIVLQPSNSGEWSLVVKKGGLTRFLYKALDEIKPCATNRLGHSTVWTGDNGWKLEFPDRDNWLKFKSLHKECFDRNKQVSSPQPSSTKIIPVPRVCEVLGYEEDHHDTFVRPDSYIISKGDELSRAMTARHSNYDMDSEDEGWLKAYNNSRFLPESKSNERVSDESFEHMIDAFEKDFYCNPHDPTDEKPAPEICLEISNKDVLEAVYGYWTKKRKHRRSALVRVFQGHQPRKAPLVPKPALRKKRSFKRQASQHGRGKQPGILQAMVAERDALEEQTALHNVQEAQELASRSMEFAINKRQKAQFLTENADLAAYRAAMALRIAEAAQVTESPDAAAAHFLD